MQKLPNMQNQKKCRECPYKLGLIKCVQDPCPKCIKSNSKTNPFDTIMKKK